MINVKVKEEKQVTYKPATPTGKSYKVWRWHLEEYGGYVESRLKKGPYCAYAIGSQGECCVDGGESSASVQEAAQKIPVFYMKHDWARYVDPDYLHTRAAGWGYDVVCSKMKADGFDVDALKEEFGHDKKGIHMS